MKQVLLKQIKQGEYFSLKDNENAPLWVRNHYDRASKTYSCSKYDDVNSESFMKPNRKVFV